MKRLVLLGGGHAHVHVLEALACEPIEDVAVTLISPYPRQIYSGMLPGWIAGHYALDECAIQLAPMAARGGCTFHQSHAVALDLAARVVVCADGTREPFDWLSIDTGPTTAALGIDGAHAHALAVRPIEDFIGGIAHMLPLLEAKPQHAVAIVGAGAAGVELAFALRHRCPETDIALIGSSAAPLDGLPRLLQWRARHLLESRRIGWRAKVRARSVDASGVLLDNGEHLPATHVLQVTGAAAPRWPGESGLAVDPAGFIRVDATLRSTSHPFVFAAGDIASYHQPRPKSGVFAVRAGPPLAANLRRVLAGEVPVPWAPQRRALYLISTGNHHALASWGPLAWWGDWVWRWKDRIDRRFMARFGR